MLLKNGLYKFLELFTVLNSSILKMWRMAIFIHHNKKIFLDNAALHISFVDLKAWFSNKVLSSTSDAISACGQTGDIVYGPSDLIQNSVMKAALTAWV